MALKGIMAKVERGMERGLDRGMERGMDRTTPGEARPSQSEAARPAPRTVAPSTSVDASSVFEGRLTCKQTLRIDGRIEGEIDCEKTVVVGEAARVHANIEAEEVQVSGVVEGNIAARRKITLERTAVVVGDLSTPGIVIEEGAKLKGRIVIGSDEEPAKDSPPARQPERDDPSKKTVAPAPKRKEAPAPQPVAAAP